MSNFTQIAILILMVASSTFVLGQSKNNLHGKWINELGSILVIDSITLDHQIIGEYRSSSGVDGKVFNLNGWVNQSDTDQRVMAISFTVRWQGYGSITSWTGYFDRDEKGYFIKTLWHLIRPTEENQWERIITNSSVFRPYNP